MEWIRISSNKLKIMLTAADAERYALRFEHVNYADAITRRAFQDILTDVKRETGFDATTDKVYIQLYPSREGGCELFVTKTGIRTTDCGALHSKTEEEILPPVRRHQTAVRLPSMEELLAVCRRMAACGYAEESTAWQDDGGRFWLLLTTDAVCDEGGELYPFLAEYGESQNAATASLLLAEHGRPICERCAVETLGAL